MRKGTGSLQISPRRLLSLLLLYIIAALAVQQVNGSPSPYHFKPQLNEKFSTLLSEGVSYVKKHRMISRCSNRYMQLKPNKGINARGSRRSSFAVLKFESDPDGTGYIRIQGDTNKRFLCFSKRARLIARSIGESERCMFKEEVHNGFIKLQSAVNPSWYVGFNSRGRKLFGYENDYPLRPYGYKKSLRRRRHQNCFMFRKTDAKIRHWRRKRPHARGPFRREDYKRLGKPDNKYRNR